MEQYIPKSVVLTEIEKRLHKYKKKYEELAHYEIWITAKSIEPKIEELKNILSLINTLEVKEVNEVPATVMVNKYGNRFISSWSGLKEYDDFKEGEEIKIAIPKK